MKGRKECRLSSPTDLGLIPTLPSGSKCSRLPEGCIKGSVAGSHCEFVVLIIMGFSQGLARRKQIVEPLRGWGFARRVQ